MMKTLFLLTLLLCTVPTLAELTAGSLFTDKAILQRDMPVQVWGTAEENASVTVTYAGQEKRTEADENGKWALALDAKPASLEEKVLTITSG